MSTFIEKIRKGFKDPLFACNVLLEEYFSKFFSDKTYLKLRYFFLMKKKLNLANPTLYNEKCQWLKLYCHEPVFTTMADKIKVKDYVADRIGKEHLIPIIGTWNSFDEIVFNELPDQFVLKCNHDSGSVLIVKNKNAFDKDAAKIKFDKALKKNSRGTIYTDTW